MHMNVIKRKIMSPKTKSMRVIFDNTISDNLHDLKLFVADYDHFAPLNFPTQENL